MSNRVEMFGRAFKLEFSPHSFSNPLNSLDNECYFALLPTIPMVNTELGMEMRQESPISFFKDYIKWKLTHSY